jgi:hypothetical protein
LFFSRAGTAYGGLQVFFPFDLAFHGSSSFFHIWGFRETKPPGGNSSFSCQQKKVGKIESYIPWDRNLFISLGSCREWSCTPLQKGYPPNPQPGCDPKWTFHRIRTLSFSAADAKDAA